MRSRPTNQLPDWRETRRRQAWELHLQGWSQHQIAAKLGITQGAVSQWFKQVHEGGGVEALRRHPAPGKTAALTEEQLGQLPELLARGAEAFGFPNSRWTTVRAATAIKEVFGVSYHPAYVSHLLRKHCPNWRDRNKPAASLQS